MLEISIMVIFAITLLVHLAAQSYTKRFCSDKKSKSTGMAIVVFSELILMGLGGLIYVLMLDTGRCNISSLIEPYKTYAKLGSVSIGLFIFIFFLLFTLWELERLVTNSIVTFLRRLVYLCILLFSGGIIYLLTRLLTGIYKGGNPVIAIIGGCFPCLIIASILAVFLFFACRSYLKRRIQSNIINFITNVVGTWDTTTLPEYAENYKVLRKTRNKFKIDAERFGNLQYIEEEVVFFAIVWNSYFSSRCIINSTHICCFDKRKAEIMLTAAWSLKQGIKISKLKAVMMSLDQ